MINHSDCEHPRTPAGRRACRARNDAEVAAVNAKPWKPTPKPKAAQRKPQPLVWAAVPRRDWSTIPEGTIIQVEHTEPWANPTGELAGPIVRDGWATVNLGDINVRSRGWVWLGVRHVPYASIKKILVHKVAP